MVTTSTAPWYEDPELWKAAIGAASAYAQTRTAKKGAPSFATQPETPEEKAYRLYAEKLAGMHGPSPTYQYLAPQIDAGLQRMAASTAGYQPLNRLDVSTGKEIPRAPLPPTAYNQFTSQPWTAAPAGPQPNGTPAPSVGGAGGGHGGGGGFAPLNRDWSSGGDYRNNLVNPTGTGAGMTPGTNASLDPNNSSLFATQGPGATRGSPATPPPGMGYGSIPGASASQVADIVKTYGWDAVKFIAGIMLANPVMSFNAAKDAYATYRGSHPSGTGSNPNTGSGVGPYGTGGLP